MRTLDVIKRLAAGGKVLRDWLGEEATPVAPERAATRAAICQPCTQNTAGRWWTLVPSKVAGVVHRQLCVKSELGMRVPNEARIGTCAVCLCHLPLKVWVPLTHIAAHTSEQVWSELPETCWMKREAGEE